MVAILHGKIQFRVSLFQLPQRIRYLCSSQKKETANSKNLVANAQFDYKFHFLPDLKANLNLGMDLASGTQDLYYPKESPIGYIENGKNRFRNNR